MKPGLDVPEPRAHVDCAGCTRPVPLQRGPLWGICQVCWLATGADGRVYAVACMHPPGAAHQGPRRRADGSAWYRAYLLPQ